MKYVLLIIAVLLAACSVEVSPIPMMDNEIKKHEGYKWPTQTLQVFPISPTEVPTEEAIETGQWNFLVLGIDKAYWRDADPRRPHTDFMVVVSVKSAGELAEVTLLQIPRNTYIPVSNIPDDFAFGFYARGGLGMLEGWVEQALGIPLTGAALMRMDSFITLIDDLGGLTVGGQHYDGLGLLTYTRFGLFERPGYDAEQKHFLILSALMSEVREAVSEDPGRALAFWNRYVDLVETDVYGPAALQFLFEQGLPLVQGRYTVESVQLEDALCTQNLPRKMSNVTRGLMVCEGIDLQEWVEEELK